MHRAKEWSTLRRSRTDTDGFSYGSEAADRAGLKLSDYPPPPS